MLPTLSPGSPITAAQANAVFEALDEALHALFGGCTPLAFLPIGGSTSWFESRLGGLLFNFGSGSKRLLTGVHAPAVHNQAVYDSQASTAVLRPGPDQYDHTLKQATVQGYLQAGITVPFSGPTHFDRSLKVQTRQFPGLTEPYFLRLAAVSLGAQDYFYNEHRHTLAVADFAFEGHAARTFTVPRAWDKFDCIRLHNLDPDSTPLTVTFQGDPDLVVEVGRWQCVSVRRVPLPDGFSWEVQGYLLFRARPEDIARFGGTFLWNHRPNAAPWLNLREADGANPVACWASLVHWLDYFSSPVHAPEISFQCGAGLLRSYHARTGLWFDDARSTHRGTVTSLPSAEQSATPLWRLRFHGGRFLLVRKPPDPPEPEPPALPQITEATATLDELLGSHASGLKLEVTAGELRLRYTGGGGPWEYIDLIPIDLNVCGPVSLPVDGSAVTVQTGVLAAKPSVQRVITGSTTPETANGLGGTVTRNHPTLGVENASDGSTVGAFTLTVGQVQGWTFGDGTRNNAHGTFLESATAWDGRRFVLGARVQVTPTHGSIFPGVGVLTGGSAEPGTPSFRFPGQAVWFAEGSWTWSQGVAMQVHPGRGGVWFTPDHPRRAWEPPPVPLYHPHALDVFGTPNGDDWRARETTLAPLSAIRRLENLPEGFHFDFSCAGYPATDSLTYLSTNPPTPEFYAAHRAAILAGDVLPDEERPILGAALQSLHYNAIVTRLNALKEVFPFSFFDVPWYGIPFRPPVGRAGIYGGHIYPGDHLANAPTGSETRTRAQDLNIPIRSLSVTHPVFTELLTVPIEGNTGSTVYSAFDQHNLLNDLLIWFKPDISLTELETTRIEQADTYFGWTPGSQVPPTQYGYRWFQTTNPEAVVPDFDYLTVSDVYEKAVELGLPFRLERLGLPLKIKVFLPDGNGFGVRTFPPPPSFLSTRTQAMLVVDASTTPQLIAYAGRSGDLFDFYWFSPEGVVRVADWPPHPSGLPTSDPEVKAMLSSLARGYNRTGSGGVYGTAVYLSTIAHGASPFSGEAPVLLLQRRVSGSQGDSRLMALPVGALQWGPSDLVSHDPPPVGPDGRFPALTGLPTLLTAPVLAGDPELAGGGYQVAILPGGLPWNVPPEP